MEEHEKVTTRVPDPATTPTMSVPEAGELLGLSRGSSYQAARAGQLPIIRCGKKLRVPTAALRRLLALDIDNTVSAE
jgi:excisionase family DNA binding protein